MFIKLAADGSPSASVYSFLFILIRSSKIYKENILDLCWFQIAIQLCSVCSLFTSSEVYCCFPESFLLSSAVVSADGMDC